jgi:hypothetical protein
MRIAVAVPEPHVTAPVLDAALEGVTRLDQELLKAGTVPTFRDMADRVRWKPEPPGQERFDHAGIVARRRWGDCDDLAPWHAASLRVTGEDPGARAFARRSGPKRWHCLVRRSDGSIDDPSIEAGMPAPGGAVGIRGAMMPPMMRQSAVVGGVYQPIPHLALRPVADRHGRPEAWQARTDLPWHYRPGNSAADVAMVSLHQSPISDQALVGACHGAIRLGEASGMAHPSDLARLAAICDACDGASWEELAEVYGEENANAAGTIVGSFFGKLGRSISRAVKHPTRLLKPLVTKVLPGAMNFVPGVGPVASMALRAATPTLQHLVKSGRHKHPKSRRHVHLTSPPIRSQDELLRAWRAWS